MSDLILPSLEIEHFRLFDHLTIERLARVNLIVGRNNVGKTALLEALWLYARRGVPAVMRDQMMRRDEASVSATTYGAITSLRHMFTNRPESLDTGLELTIGPANDPRRRLSVGIEPPTIGSMIAEQVTPRYVIRYGGQLHLTVDLLSLIFDIDGLPTLPNIQAAFVTADTRMNPAYLKSLWEAIALTDDEEQVVVWLRAITPEIERISIKSDANGRAIPIARVHGNSETVALRSYGDGLVRLFSIVLAALNARNGFLLLDEVENGIHYMVQPDVWRFLIQLATAFNIQVFATTHSSDCIEAFHMALAEHDADGQIIRLIQHQATISALRFDAHDLAAVMHDHIEVR